MKIKLFNSDSFDALRKDIDAALKPIQEKYGLTQLEFGNISYPPDRLSFRGHLLAKVDIAGSKEATEAANKKYERASQLLGYNKNIVGEKFSSATQAFEVTDIKLDRPKYPIVAKGSDGKFYKFTTKIRFDNKEILYKYNDSDF